MLTASAEIVLCRLKDIAPGIGRAFDVQGRRIAVFRTRAGTVHAVDNACPHRGAPLADGMLVGNSVVCPYHAQRFDLASGQCDTPGACGIRAYPARVEEGMVLLGLPLEDA